MFKSRVLIYLTIYFFLVFLTGVFLRYFKFLGASPEFLLVFLAAFSLMSGPNFGVVFGFFSGLFMDFTSVYLVGSQSLIYATTGYVMGLLSKKLYANSMGNQLISIFVISVAVRLMTYFLGEIFGVSYHPNFRWFFLTVIYNVLIAGPIFYISEKLRKKLKVNVQ